MRINDHPGNYNRKRTQTKKFPKGLLRSNKGFQRTSPLVASRFPHTTSQCYIGNTHKKFIVLQNPSKKELSKRRGNKNGQKLLEKKKKGWRRKKKKEYSDGPNLQFENGDALHSHELACTSRIYLKTKLFGIYIHTYTCVGVFMSTK